MSPIFVDTEDEISQIFFAHGAAGSSESLQFTQPDLTYEPRIMSQRMKALDFFFMENPSTALFEEVSEKFPQLTLTQYQEEQQDWMAEWKKHFKAFALVKDFW
ncbi:MAG: 50S ribosomal protein L11 methyltransferase, partial [Pseudobdellovibrionaceae bacterium]